jgi:hypothetical protein
MIIEWLFTFLILYLLYKLIFDFIVPVYRTSAQMRDKINQMNQQNQYQQKQSSHAQPPKEKPKASSHADEYIDFEEIK